MIKWIAIIIFALIGLLDVLLILGSAELERRRNEEARTTIIPQGEWIDKGGYAICSNCRAHSEAQYDGVPVPLKTRYCPNCGCRMKGADDE